MTAMNSLELYKTFLQDQLIIQKKNMRFSFFFFIVLIALGILVTLIFFTLPNTKQLSEIIKIGPSILMTAISSFQFKPFAASRERVSAFETLNKSIERHKYLPQDQIEMIEQIISDIIKETMKR